MKLLDNNSFNKSKSGDFHILYLPNEIISIILRQLDPRSLVNASHVCKYWSNICSKDPILRKRIFNCEKTRKRLRWCRAKYGDGTTNTNKLYKGSKEILRKQKFRLNLIGLLFYLFNTVKDFSEQNLQFQV
ncbi:F-box-like [Popillia japonica]|uniref:F-box-like n=1 Tax=Popillia japonica TaxID=7064 RepID=A0AAW1JZA5_POPJA